MAAPSSSRRSKRNMAASVSEPLAKSSKVTLLSPSLLLLEIPSDTNTSLPIWDAMRAQHVDVTWTVNPYSVSVHFTPKTSKQEREGTPSDVAKPSFGSTNVLQPHMVIQSITPLHDTSQNTTRVLLTFSQNTTQIFAGQQQQKRPLHPEPATSFIFSLPLIITQPQPVPQPIASATAAATGKLVLRSAQAPEAALSKAPVPTPYHTKSCSDVLICDDFLLSKCLAGRKCKMHHTPYPFHWQRWNVFSQEWVDFPIHAQALLERIYCNVEQDVIGIKDGRDGYTLTFDTMEVDDPSDYDRVRRLTNSDSPERNSFFPSSWKIYWWNNTTWKEYDKKVSNVLRKAMQEKEPECSFYISSQAYKVDFTTMSQTNITTGFLRDVRWRPEYRSPASMMPHLQTGIQIDPTKPATGPPGENFSVDPLGDFSTWYPPVWRLSSQEEEYSLVDVPTGTKAYQSIQSLFYQSLPDTKVDIISIEQVQNQLHWDKYQRHKAYMQKQHTKSKEPLERHLFHGTSKESAEDICHNNFDPRVAGINGVSYGYGSYFSTTASYSHTFTAMAKLVDTRHMFLAKVLVGKVYLGQNNFRRPPPLVSKTKQHCLYDSCVDNVYKPSMFVVFDSCQCYPYYLIKYKTLPKEIVI